MGDKAVLAYSGGLDTSVTIRWLVERGYEVHAVAVDVGQQEDFASVIERGQRAGAASVRVVDAVDRYAAEYLTKAIKANGCMRASTRWCRASPARASPRR